MTSVAVTGADGFIGSHLVDALVRQGRTVRALVQYNSVGSWGWLEDLDPDVLTSVDVHLGDLRDAATVKTCLSGSDLVYHLGALIAVPYSFHAPRSYVETNVLGTQNVLDAALDAGTRVVHTSTSEVYGNALTIPITEDHTLTAQSPYAASKIAADKLVESYVAAYDLHAVTIRPFNTFGPRQSARAFIPTVLAQALTGADAITVGSLTPRRDLLFVADTAAAFLAVGALQGGGWPGTVLNAGTGKSWTMGQVVNEVGRVVGRELRAVEDPARVRPHASEVQHLESDSSRLRDATGWAPQVSLTDGLNQTLSWMRQGTRLAQYKPTIYQL